MFKNVASQKLVVFAFDSTTNTPKTGDAANITAYVSKDFGAATVLGDTTATEIDSTNAKGYYLFDLTQAETNADVLTFTAKSSTANIVVLGAPPVVYTYPANFTATAITSGGIVQGDLQTIKTQTVTCSGGVTIPAATLASTTNITAATGITVSTNSDKTGYSLTQSFPSNFSAMSITAGGVVKADLDTIKTQTVTCSGGVTVPAATLASTTNITSASGITVSTNNDKTGYSLTQSFPANFSSLGINASGHVSRVTLCDTTTTNTDMLTAAGVWAAATRTLTANTNLNDPSAATIATAVLTTAMTESYNTDGSPATLSQALYAIMQVLTESSISGTTLTVKKLDGSTTAMTLTLSDASTPTSVTRAS